jgi:hypothetical protein
MAEHAEVFISGTTRDLGTYRMEIKDALLTLQIFPIEESNFTLAYGPLTAMLGELIGRCDAVIHLAGRPRVAMLGVTHCASPFSHRLFIEVQLTSDLGKI